MNRNQTQRPASPYVVIEEQTTYQDYINDRRNYSKALVNKWAWLLEGTKKQKLTPIPEHMHEAMAILFENQQAICRGYTTEQTLKTDIALPEKYALPIIRQVYPQLIVNKVASMQPMPLASGGVARIFYQDFQRENASNTSLSTLDSDYAIGAENSVPKKVKMVITSSTVTAIKDILGAVWSTEVQEDARGALGIDVEGELVQQMGMEIMREIEQRVLAEMLLWASAGNVNWSWTNSGTYADKEHYETLGHALIDMDDLIYGQRYRSGEWIIAGRNVIKYIRKMQDFRPEPRNLEDMPFNMGVQLVGRIEGFWDVYMTPMIDTNRAIMGIYPRSMTDTGYVYAPYIPLTPMPLVYAEFQDHDDATMPGAYVNTDKWSRNIRTRYGKKLVLPQLFATLSISA